MDQFIELSLYRINVNGLLHDIIKTDIISEGFCGKQAIDFILKAAFHNAGTALELKRCLFRNILFCNVREKQWQKKKVRWC